MNPSSNSFDFSQCPIMKEKWNGVIVCGVKLRIEDPAISILTTWVLSPPDFTNEMLCFLQSTEVCFLIVRLNRVEFMMLYSDFGNYIIMLVRLLVI